MQSKILKFSLIAAVAVFSGIAAQAQSVKTNITLPSQPAGLAVDYLANRIYVALPSFGGPSDSLAIINGDSDTLVDTISIPPVAHDVAVDVVTDTIYVGGSYTDENGVQQSQIVVINGRSNKVVRVIPITETSGSGIQGITVNSLTGTVYVANASDNIIAVIHRGSASVNDTISVAPSPFGVAINPFNFRLYVALTDGTVDVIDTVKQTVVTTTTIGGANVGIAANWTTGNVFVTDNNYGPSTVGVLDSKGNVVTNVAVGSTPLGIDVDLGTNLVFVANTVSDSVSVINGANNTVTSTLPVAGLYVAVNPVTEKVYIADQNSAVTVLKEK
jgi:YVTN family beta-propeller protein